MDPSSPWPYLLTFFLAVATDLIPVIGPPVWMVLVFMVSKYDLHPWLVLAVGVPASVLGRYGLSLYIPHFSNKLIKQRKNDELKFVGNKLNGSLWRTWLFVGLYTLLPLSTTALFSAAGLAKIKPFQILPPFFVGKFVSDAIMVFTGNHVVHSLKDAAAGAFSPKGIITMAAGLLILGAFLFLDWRILLQQKKLRLNFHIWK